MKPAWMTLPPGPNPPEEVFAIIEISKGCNVKYEMDHETGLIFVDRVLHTAFTYPFDYGIIPQTWYFDGDPIDIMVLSRSPLFPGSVVTVRPVGLILMRDEKGEDSKILSVPTKDPMFKGINEVSDVPESTIREIEHFLAHYKDLETGKWVKVEKWGNALQAKNEIVKGMEMYKSREKF